MMNIRSKALGTLLLALLLTGGVFPSHAADMKPSVKAEAFVAEKSNPSKPEETVSSAADADSTAAVEEKTAAEEEKPAVKKPQVDPLAGRSEKLVKEFYLTDGGTYDKVTEIMEGLNPEITGLPADKNAYYLRIDKKLTDKYFRRVRAYDETSHEQIGDYFVARDKTSVWRMDGEEPGMIYGSAEKLLKKSRLVVYPKYLALGSKGVVRLLTPGNVPFTVSAKSMNEAIATIGSENSVEPVAAGKAAIMVDYTLGDQKGTAVREVNVVTKEQLQQMIYDAYVTRIYMERMMWYDDFWGWPYWGGWYGYRRHPGPPPRRGHRPPPPRDGHGHRPPPGGHRPPPKK